jgi:hypothetical protein
MSTRLFNAKCRKHGQVVHLFEPARKLPALDVDNFVRNFAGFRHVCPIDHDVRVTSHWGEPKKRRRIMFLRVTPSVAPGVRRAGLPRPAKCA